MQYFGVMEALLWFVLPFGAVTATIVWYFMEKKKNN
jgi:hypothetical protein